MPRALVVVLAVVFVVFRLIHHHLTGQPIVIDPVSLVLGLALGAMLVHRTYI